MDAEASRSLVYSKLYEASIKTKNFGFLNHTIQEKSNFLMVELAILLIKQLQLDVHIC